LRLRYLVCPPNQDLLEKSEQYLRHLPNQDPLEVQEQYRQYLLHPPNQDPLQLRRLYLVCRQLAQSDLLSQQVRNRTLL
jgi:hypothetical protein